MDLYAEAVGGDARALRFLQVFYEWCHFTDDVVDGELPATPENIVRVAVGAFAITREPFYRAHADELDGVILTVINLWADTAAFERAPEEWKRQWAAAARSCGNEVIVAAARIVMGWDHARKISAGLREHSWKTQNG